MVKAKLDIPLSMVTREHVDFETWMIFVPTGCFASFQVAKKFLN
jgi:hypothetical protein